MKMLLEFLAVALFVFLADFVWLGIVMKSFYQQEMGELMRQGPDGFFPRLIPAVLVYLLIPLGVVMFVGPRVGPTGTMLTAILWGAGFGLILYGVYDLSNLAVLEKWTLRVTIADILWGMFLCGSSTLVLILTQKFLTRSS